MIFIYAAKHDMPPSFTVDLFRSVSRLLRPRLDLSSGKGTELVSTFEHWKLRTHILQRGTCIFLEHLFYE